MEAAVRLSWRQIVVFDIEVKLPRWTKWWLTVSDSIRLPGGAAPSAPARRVLLCVSSRVPLPVPCVFQWSCWVMASPSRKPASLATDLRNRAVTHALLPDPTNNVLYFNFLLFFVYALILKSGWVEVKTRAWIGGDVTSEKAQKEQCGATV